MFARVYTGTQLIAGLVHCLAGSTEHRFKTELKISYWQMKLAHMLHLIYLHMIIQGDFFHWYPPKKLKYGKPRLGESTST